jgi:ABC-2 type transport system ATP-binding protein
MGGQAIVVEGLHKHYGDLAALDGVDFEVPEGSVFGLLGPNGAGKTTTVKMISGLVRPTSGEVYVSGMHVESKRRQVLRKVGVVLEGTRTCIWPLTPFENLKYFGNLRDIKGPVLKERARSLLHFIGLKEKMDVQVRYLSRGEKQKVAICIALISDPDVVLLDEPTTGLDVQSSRAIKEKIVQMTREQGKAALVTTHDMHVAQQLCDRIGIIDKGNLVACRPTEQLLELFDDQAFEFRLDRLPEPAAVEGIPGVAQYELVNGQEGPLLVIHVRPALEERSQALYATVERLKGHGVLLRSVTQRQQSLENVFVRLTTSTV